MNRIVVRQGSKEYCESYINEIKSMGYTIVDYVLTPFGDEWMIAINYEDED